MRSTPTAAATAENRQLSSIGARELLVVAQPNVILQAGGGAALAVQRLHAVCTHVSRLHRRQLTSVGVAAERRAV